VITLKEFIKKNALTNAAVAEAFNVSPQMVSQWVNDSRIFVDEKSDKILRISVVRDKVSKTLNI
jgi:predicted XRE-type DNA-binding protein